MYSYGISIALYISILIFLLFWSESIRQIILWINDNDEAFTPWIKNNKKFIFITRFIPRETFDEPLTYFGIFCSLMLPAVLILLIIAWPIMFVLIIGSFVMHKLRDRKRKKKEEQNDKIT